MVKCSSSSKDAELYWYLKSELDNIILIALTYLKLETLRLYPPILALPKWTNENPQTIQIGEKLIIIPPHTGVSPSLLAIQTHPDHWRDPLVWQPSRWISTPVAPADNESSSNLTSRLRQEAIVSPVRGTYFPWSDGPQNCPGAKFAQVEFVAVLACIFRDYRMRIVPTPNEDWTQAKGRALATTEDCDLGLLLRMRVADQVRITCERV